jgi:hypothetical protein
MAAWVTGPAVVIFMVRCGSVMGIRSGPDGDVLAGDSAAR